MKRLLILVLSIVSTQTLFAQNDVDALRYSQTTFGGTARSMGMGGAFGALGGDISTLSTNPAGLGLYSKSEITITPNLFSDSRNSQYFGKTGSADKYNFNLNNLGIVLTYPTGNETGWVSYSFAVGYNRLADFSSQLNFNGFNDKNSLTTNFVDRVNGNINDTSDAVIGLAWQTGLIYHDPKNKGSFTSDMPNGYVNQRGSITKKGGMGETDFSLGADYNDKLYLGATLGIISLNYTENSTYEEMDSQNRDTVFKSLTFKQNITTTGNGFNLKLGGIFRPNDWFRIGLAYHLPTFLSLTDVYSYGMTANFDKYFNGQNQFSASYDGNFDYQIMTPSRTIVSAGFVIAKKAILSGDFEFVNYGSARLSANGENANTFDDANKAIADKYRRVVNIRLGGEYRFASVFSARAGFAYYPSPFNAESAGIKRDITNLTFGLGLRDKGYFVDLAYVYSQSQEIYVPYKLDVNEPYVTQDVTNSRLALTFGVRF